MSYVEKTIECNRKNYGSARDTKSIKYIVIHNTANDGDNAENNGKYFQRDLKAEGKSVASAHYFIDNDSVVKSVSDNYVAYSVGGSKRSGGGASLYGIAKNANTLNIEMCDEARNGVVEPTPETLDNVMNFVVGKMLEHNIDINHVIRHYDVNGKSCPQCFLDERKWNDFKAEVAKRYNGLVGYLQSLDKPKNPYAEPTSNVRKGSLGQSAKWLQWELAQAGYSEVKVDGICGKITDRCLRDYQSKHGLVVDGICGKATRASLKMN